MIFCLVIHWVIFTLAQSLRFVSSVNGLTYPGITETDVRFLLFDENFYLSENQDEGAVSSEH